MKLARLTLNNFKRFRGRVSVALTTKLVALVGPNEAGKSTVLEGLQLLSGLTPLRLNGPAQHATRGETIDESVLAVEGLFELSPGDREAISRLTTTNVSTCSVGRFYKSSDLQFRFPEALARNISDRHLAHTALQDAFRDNPDSDLPALASNSGLVALEILGSEDQSRLSKTQRRTLSAFASALAEKAKAVSSLTELAKLTQLVAEREEVEVEKLVADALVPRLPKYLMFTADDRDLQSEYDISAYYREKDRQPIPIALRNITLASGLKLDSLFKARAANDTGEVRTQLAAANSKLTHLMQKNWSQSDVSVQLDLNNYRLSLLVESHGSNQFTLIAARSDVNRPGNLGGSIT